MRIAYFDCFSGISGDMAIAAFLDAGLGMNSLTKGLARLKLKDYEIKKSKAFRAGLAGTKFDCIVKEKGHNHRSLKEILALIDKSSLKAEVKTTATNIFTAIGKAEAKIHGVKSDDYVRLHEVGDVDSIVDVVGTAIAIDELGIDAVYSSKINLGRAFVRSSHGLLPIPAPATLELLKGIPSAISEISSELVTPTGAGILKALSKGFGPMPEIKISAIGYGAGTHDPEDRPNMLRVIIGERSGSFRTDRIFIIEANIDDMNPQIFEYVFERLFKEGALDVYLESIMMKKSRPAFKLSVLCAPGDLERISSVIFSETTTIGVRFYEANRFKLDRSFVRADTKYGKVRVKLSGVGGKTFTASPEYDECVKIARSKNVPLKTILEEAKRKIKT